MRRQGEGPNDRRSVMAVLLLVLLITPILVGAAAPAAVRELGPPVELPAHRSIGAVEAIPAESPQPGAPSPMAEAPSVGAVEHLGDRELPARPAQATQSWRAADTPPGRGERTLAPPTLKPHDAGWVARHLEIPGLGVSVAVAMAGSTADELFPPYGGAYILRSSAQPGRGTNSYLFAHAMPELFKPLWWARAGQQVIVTMSDGQQLGYRVTAVVRNIPCPDPSKPKPAGLPPVLANATECDMSWTLPTSSERLTMQTSQGFNRNYGEMVVIAEPDW